MTTIVMEPRAQLLEDYSNCLDTSTILAILSDYDLSNATELDTARQTLDILKSTVNIDEATGFDPSGASGTDALEGNTNGEDESASARSARNWKSQTDDTSVNQDAPDDHEALDFSESSRSESPNDIYPNILDGLDEESKESVLVGMFPALKPFDVKWTLKKCKGDAGLAVDELMTQSFLEESGTRHRGVEAFSEGDAGQRSRKGRGKRKGKTRTEGYTSTQDSPISPSTPSSSKWDTGTQDVDFITEKTGMPMQQVKSIYHDNNWSIHDSITALIKAHADLDIEPEDPMVHINAAEMRQTFPTISQKDLEILVQITYPSIHNARDLAEALASRPTNKKTGIQLELRHAPLNLDPSPTKAKIRAHNAVHPTDIPDGVAAAAQAASYYEARNKAFTQAQAAYRKGKSNPLMGGAAAYYSEIGRDLDSRGKSAESQAADALIAGQSSRYELDLHGVSVKDAVRISRERVTGWWHELGEDRIRGRGVGGGYKIVTGVGHHSEGNRGKLGPAVGKMLLREGWKFEVSSGFLVVTGVAKTK